MRKESLDQHIEITPGVCGGKPRIAGRRITVSNIAIWHERLGLNANKISTEYDLELSDIYAALAYYFDHREEIDEAIANDETFAEELRQSPNRSQTFAELLASMPNVGTDDDFLREQ